jgi:Leucine-rich repeat (LRR) protein
LKILKISQCNLQCFPSSVLELTSLNVLHIFINSEIKEIPKLIKNLGNLEEFDISRCNIEDISNIFFLKNLKNFKGKIFFFLLTIIIIKIIILK